MASAISHAVAALALGSLFRWNRPPLRYWAAGVFCAVIPDADSIGFALGIRYGDLLGHRGLSHSLLFAAVLAPLLAFTLFREEMRAGGGASKRMRLCAYLFLAAASHGLLDAVTNGGLGVAFLSPFDATRYFFPFRPVEVSPISVARFLQGRGLDVLASELKWIILPALALGAAAESARRLLPPRRAVPARGNR
jgi:inner membrane protein